MFDWKELVEKCFPLVSETTIIDGAIYSGRFGGANTGERIQSAYRWDQLHISFFFF